MGGESAPAPMGGASEVPPQDEFAGAPNDGQNIGAGPGMEDPSMGGEPPMDGMADGNGQLDPGMGDAPMPDDGGESADGAEGGDDSTMSLFNQLSDEDKEAARGYIESMLQRDEEKNDDGMGEDMPENEPIEEPDGQEPPMMESVIFKKSQLEHIHENLMATELEKDVDKVEKKKKSKSSNKSPFNSPNFN